MRETSSQYGWSANFCAVAPATPKFRTFSINPYQESVQAFHKVSCQSQKTILVAQKACHVLMLAGVQCSSPAGEGDGSQHHRIHREQPSTQFQKVFAEEIAWTFIPARSKWASTSGLLTWIALNVMSNSKTHAQAFPSACKNLG